MLNQLILGDNLTGMDALLVNHYGAFDLVYIDPPFATNNTFRASDERSATISVPYHAEVAYNDHYVLDDYLEFLRSRVVVARELMSSEASFYIHTDTKVGHYVKVMLDGIFGRGNFRNDITRIKSNPKNFSRRAFGNQKDMILFYTKTDSFIWNEPRVQQTESEIRHRYNKIDSLGRRYTTTPLHAPGETRNGPTGEPWRGMMPPTGRHWRCSPAELDALDAAGLIEWSSTSNPRKIIYAEDAIKRGAKMQDVWEYKDPQIPTYPTQKNLEMLETIVAASSNRGSAVLDFFCGSGTTLLAASKLGRSWVGIDESEVAIRTAKETLAGLDYQISESPTLISKVSAGVDDVRLLFASVGRDK